MKILLYVTTVATVWWLGVEGVYREKDVKQLKLNAIPNSALFGYSLAYQATTGRLIVSAPRADSVGKVYECQNDLNCTEIFFSDIKGNPITGMWLGASVASGENFTMACAPRATQVATNETATSTGSEYSKTGTFGRCYIHTTDGKTTQLQQLKKKDRYDPRIKFEEHYMDSLGWALQVDRNNSIIVGGPGMFKGRAIKYPSVTADPSSLMFPYNINNSIGYSVTSGYFLNNKLLYTAISSPYGAFGEGTVILSNGSSKYWALPSTKEYSPPVGSLFGASLCAAKLRGVGQREALLVGASLYPAKGGVDVGAVYVYQYDPAKGSIIKNLVVHQKTILGIGDRGQFGSTIINLGDINGDKRDDVAISAPYEEDGRGSVYIYSAADILGDDPADHVRYLQKLQPEGYSSFGYSMATPKPHQRSCGDLAIGAPENNTVFVYHCIQKVIVRVKKLKRSPRSIRSNTEFEYEACIAVEYPNNPNVNVVLKIEVALTHPTATIKTAEGNNLWRNTINVAKEKNKKKICNKLTIILPEEGSSPQIQYQMSVSQTNPLIGPNDAMLSDISVLTLTDTLWVADCADKCKPVLTFEVSTTLQDGYVIGSTNNESVSVSVHNTGDPAYTSCVHIAVSQNVRVYRWPRGCRRNGPGAGTCAPDRPIRNQSSWNTEDIMLDMSTLRSNLKELAFTVNLYEECSPELTAPSLKTITKTISLNTDPRGLAVREYTNFGNTFYLSFDEINETGKRLSHIYTVYNIGSTTWVDIACAIAFDKKSFFKRVVVTIDTQATYECEDVIEYNNGKYATKCSVSELKSDQKFDVIVSIYIEPGTIDWNTLENDNITLTSYFQVSFGEKSAVHTLTSLLRKREALVPLWVIIVAALVGLLIVFLIAFALYECGFLKRKKREQLQKLRRSVHRQSMRRSAIEHESKRGMHKAMDPQSDEKKLIEESEDRDTPSPSPSAAGNCPPLPLAEGKKPSMASKKKPQMAEEKKPPMPEEKKPPMAEEKKPPMAEEKKPPLPEQKPMADQLKNPARVATKLPQSKSASEELINVEQSGSTPPPADNGKIRKELIILGLQKNLGRYPVKPPKPRTQEPSFDQQEDQEIYDIKP